jgi:chaperonin GroES
LCAVCQSSSTVRFLPLLDRVLIRRIVPAAKTAGGVLLPEATGSKVNTGVVVAVGSGGRDREGRVISPSVKEGDKVLLPEYGGSSLKLNNEELTIYREQDILGIMQD